MTAFLMPLLLASAETPEKTVRSFVEAFDAQDSAGMGRQVVDPHPFGYPFTSNYLKLAPKIGGVRIDGPVAKVDVDLGVLVNAKIVDSFHDTVELRLEEGDWRIVPAVFRPRKTADGGEGTLAGIAAILTDPQASGSARSAAKQTQSLNNVKQIAIATLMYAGDHQDRLPSAKGFQAAVRPYLKNLDVFTAPGAPKGTVGYFLDPRLSGLPMTAISSPASTAMILQGTANRAAFPYGGRAPLGYADGHVKLVDAAKTAAARKVRL